ncbi:hypothetical protein YDYSG_21270 [Paenibacillus tyrfis]|nr:hypothetical protein YDYSG_21270 [Paenibacillus tyrfis]
MSSTNLHINWSESKIPLTKPYRILKLSPFKFENTGERIMLTVAVLALGALFLLAFFMYCSYSRKQDVTLANIDAAFAARLNQGDPGESHDD